MASLYIQTIYHSQQKLLGISVWLVKLLKHTSIQVHLNDLESFSCWYHEIKRLYKQTVDRQKTELWQYLIRPLRLAILDFSLVP